MIRKILIIINAFIKINVNLIKCVINKKRRNTYHAYETDWNDKHIERATFDAQPATKQTN